MSYEIIKRIRYIQGRVMLTHAANTDRPRIFHEDEAELCTRIMRSEGFRALDKHFLWQFFSQQYRQGNKERYQRAILMARLKEGIIWSNEIKKCCQEEYRNAIVEKLYYYLNYMPLPQKCHLVWGQYPIKILRGNNLVQCIKGYTVFNSAEEAGIWAMCCKYDEKQFRIVNEE